MASRSDFVWKLNLDNKSSRRIGITKPRQSLFRTIDGPTKSAQEIMPPKNAPKRSSGHTKKAPVEPVQAEDDEDINRVPDNSSDDERPSPNIKPTTFTKGSEKQNGISALGKKQNKPTINGNPSPAWKDDKGGYRGTSRPRRGANDAPSSSASSASKTSPKRKSPADTPKLGAGMFDAFGQAKVKKAKTTYGNSSQARSSQSKSASQRFVRKASPEPPKFRHPGSIPSSPTSDFSPRKSYQNHRLDDDPTSTPKTVNKFEKPSMTPWKEEEEQEQKAVFQKIGLDDLEESFTQSSADPDESLLPHPGLQEKPTEPPVATQVQKFQVWDMDDSVREKVTALVGETGNNPPPAAILDDDEFLTMTQAARCPMCHAPVDPADIRAFGKNMNIRMQEKFCRSHRTKTAKEDWEDRDYPTIKWEKLDRRITQHHALIKKMIKGEDSYYRAQMEEKINAGKDRSLMKMTTNLTPGYYGARGLRAISENIMHKFTPLLKKRIVDDKLMSARGVTPYVQSVLVLEVASRLIMEDMKVNLEQARDILAESAEVGELLNEEVRDVVKKTVDDSEDEDDEDYD